MIRNRPRAAWLTAALAVTVTAVLAAPAMAQDETLTPEGSDWRLTSYLADEALVAVPLGVDATLLLEGGQATGSGGCNTFSGTYALDGATLMFDEQVSTTLLLCEPDVQAIEDAYLAALPQVAGWAVSEGALQLSDELGSVILTFEVPDISLTGSELTLLVTTLAGLRSDADSLRTDLDALRAEILALNVPRLRDRVRVLEQGAAELQDQVDELARTGNTDNGGNGFTRAEAILLEGVPTRIASRCVPLRSGLPKGTLAAVRCTPVTTEVASVDYHLMEGDDAAAAFRATMDTFNVPQASSEESTCESGVKSQQVFVGSGWQSVGCYRTAGKAEVRFVDNATDCRQLRVGQKRLKSPTVYLALQGTSGDVAAVHAWATRNLSASSSQLTSITQPIERPNEPLSPSCPT